VLTKASPAYAMTWILSAGLGKIIHKIMVLFRTSLVNRKKATLRSAAQPPRFTGRAVRDAAGEHRGRRDGNQTFRYAPMPQQKKSQDNLNPQMAQIYADV